MLPWLPAVIAPRLRSHVAERLGVSPSFVYGLCSSRKLKFCRIGNGRGVIRITEEAVGEYLGCTTYAPREQKSYAPAARLKHLKL